MATDIASDFGAFLEKSRAQNEQEAFAEQVQDLAKQYRDVCRDLECERIAGRHAQERAEKCEQDLQAMEESVSRSAFVLVLVDADADAYLFNEKYSLGDPVEGGKRAALELKRAVREYLRTAKSEVGDLPIVVKAFANGDGLAQLLVRAGLLKGENSLSMFTRGFSGRWSRVPNWTNSSCVRRIETFTISFNPSWPELAELA